MKRTRITMLFAALAVTLTVHGGALTLDTVQSAAEPQTPETPATQTQTTLAATATPQVPGLNYISGTTAVEDFESVASAVYDPTNNGKWAGKLKYDKANAADKQSAIFSLENAKTNGTSAYPADVTGNDSKWVWYDIITQTTASQGNHQFIVKGNFENGRKYWFGFDYYTNMFTVWGRTANFAYYVTQTGKAAETWTPGVRKAVKDDNTWYSYSNREFTYTGTDGGSIKLQTQIYKKSGTAAFFYDNIMVMPYYKINYITEGGTKTDQVLFADAAKTQIITTYVPKTDNYPTSPTLNKRCIGWSTEQGSTEPMTEIALANADVDLYPVWQVLDEYLWTDTPVISAVSGTTAEVRLAQYTDNENESPYIEYRWDTGVTGANVVDNGNGILTVTAAGCPGEIVFTAVRSDNAEEETLTLRLFGGTTWRPGLDLATGTTKPLDFEGLTAEEIGYAYKLANFTVETDAETGNTFVTSTGAYKYLSPKIDIKATPIETARPFLFNYQYKGTLTQHLIVMNGAVSWDMRNTTRENWGAVNFMHKASNDAASLSSITSVGIGSNSASPWYSFDNVQIIPSYKITYVALDNSTSSVYALCDSSMNLLSEYTVDADKLGTDFYSLTADGEMISVSVPVKLENQDITVYARRPVDTPVSIGRASIRADHYSGIRFASYIAPDLRDRASEYGYLIARTDMLGGTELTFDPSKLPTAEPNVTFTGTTAAGVAYIGAANYIKTGETTAVDKIYKYGESGNAIFGTHANEADVFFTGVLTGLEKPYTVGSTIYRTRYNVNFTARPYVKIGDNYFYGTTVSASMKDVAQALKDSGTLTPGSAEKTLVDTVLADADKTVEATTAE